VIRRRARGLVPPGSQPAEGRRGGLVARTFAFVVVHLRLLLVPAWIALAALATIYLPSVNDTEASSLSLVPKDSAAVAAERAILREFGYPLFSRVQIVQRDPNGLSPVAQARAVGRATDVDRGLHRAEYPGILGAIPVTNTGRLMPGSREDSTTAITYLFVNPSLDIYQQLDVAEIFAHREADRPDDHLVGVTGAVPARAYEGDAITSNLPWVELATVALIALIVGVHFRSPVAPLVTLTAAGIAYLVTIRVVIGLLVSVTFVPGVLGLFGRALFWPSAPPRQAEPTPEEIATEAPAARASPATPAPAERGLPDETTTRGWRFATARAVTRRPVAFVVCVVVGGGLALAATFLRQTTLGISLPDELPDNSEPAVAARAAGEGFAPGDHVSCRDRPPGIARPREPARPADRIGVTPTRRGRSHRSGHAAVPAPGVRVEGRNRRAPGRHPRPRPPRLLRARPARDAGTTDARPAAAGRAVGSHGRVRRGLRSGS